MREQSLAKIVIVGSSGHAKCVIDIIERNQCYAIAGLLDDYRSIGERTDKHEVIGGIADLPELAKTASLAGVIVAIGDNFARSAVVSRIQLLCPALPLISAVHPNAIIGSNVEIGSGTVVMAGAVIAPACSIGTACIVNTLASIDHDSQMSDYASLAPRAVTGGNCRIGKFAAVGIGAVLLHRISVGDHTVVGAGALVTKNVEGFCVAYGSPARRIRTRVAGESYL